MPGVTRQIAAGARAVHRVALTPGQVDKVQLADDANVIEVITDQTDDVFVRYDGVDPAIDGAGAFRIPASMGVRELAIPTAYAEGGVELRLIAASAVSYSVTKLN